MPSGRLRPPRPRRSSESATGEYTISALVTDLVAVHDALGLREPVLVGHSLGATVAVEAAVRRPCAGVVTVDGGLPVKLPAALDDRATFDVELRRPLVRLAGWLAARAGHGHHLTTDQLWQLTQELRRRERDLDAVYEQLTAPVLQVLPGRADPVPWGAQVHAATDAAASRFRAAHPGVTQLWLDAGHAIPLEQPAELAAEIRRFALVER
nr:alpha/beta hydrolase [Jiangella gansuensis]